MTGRGAGGGGWRWGDDAERVGAVSCPDCVDAPASSIRHLCVGCWGEEGVEPDTFCESEPAYRGAGGAERNGQLVDPPPPQQPFRQPGDLGWGTGANRVDQLVLPIDCGGGTGWNQESVHRSVHAAPGLAHRGPPGAHRDVQVGDSSTRQTVPAELDDIEDHRRGRFRPGWGGRDRQLSARLVASARMRRRGPRGDNATGRTWIAQGSTQQGWAQPTPCRPIARLGRPAAPRAELPGRARSSTGGANPTSRSQPPSRPRKC